MYNVCIQNRVAIAPVAQGENVSDQDALLQGEHGLGEAKVATLKGVVLVYQ